MVVQLISQISFMVLVFGLATASPPIAKSGCQDHCGNIIIPFPFGIGEGCYRDKWFEIECNKTSNSSRALISSIKMEVLNISAESGRALVKGPIMSYNCSGRASGSPVNFTGTPFAFSYSNRFAAVGCNTRAFLGEFGPPFAEFGPAFVGCDTTCGNESKAVDGQKNDICSGNRCCQAPVLLRREVFHPELGTANESQATGGCKLAFLADRTWFSDNITDPLALQHWEYVPVVLEWSSTDNHHWRYDNRTMDCDYDILESNNNLRAYECSCVQGYEGNPYLGCVDIDECKAPKQHLCQGITKCANKPGTYICEVNKVWIIIIVISAVIGVLSLLAGIWWLYKVVRKMKKIEVKKKFFKRNGGLLLQRQVSSIDGSVQKTKIYSSKELEKATDRFNENRILGQGGQGTVYKGMLEDGRIVAVKKSKIVDEEKVEEFINEVVILSQINHRNVVRLLGCCLETEVPLLVYEFIPNGNLFQYLHNQNEEFLLSWEIRLQIATEAAGALFYLHSAAYIPIYHRDIKSTNILLDEKHKAKISDFGTSRSIAIDQTHLTTHVQGTFGYLDPEYFRSGQFTEKSDVYSFGVVLVELLSGQKPIFSASSTESRSLATYFILLMEDNKLSDILDARVKEHCHYEEVIGVANLAKRCLDLIGKNRPTMKEVATELERIVLSRKKSNVEQNSEEIENSMVEIINEWDAISTSTTYGFENGRALSSDDKQLIAYETW